ncbi:MAG: hypothetical protein QNJ45_15810 [Ardenticatenaceae bacterium]|nr:hypothetical protein [Ardenticatenaceae bacterium]
MTDSNLALNQVKVTLPAALIKTVVTHSITYFLMGILASTMFDYATWFAESNLNVMMRPVSDPMVMAGPLFQPIRGVLFGVVFYLLREQFFERKYGWLIMWFVLVIMGIINTFGPTPGSIEGMLYTIFPLEIHLRGLPEVIFQALLLSLILYYWVNHPQQKWLNWVMGLVFLVMMALPVLGLITLAA